MGRRGWKKLGQGVPYATEHTAEKPDRNWGGGARKAPQQAKAATCFRCGYFWTDHTGDLGPYNKWCLRRWTAGVLAWFHNTDTGLPCFLFGEEKRHDGGYNVFWGFGEMSEHLLEETAARECAEEALGLLGSAGHLEALLREKSCDLVGQQHQEKWDTGLFLLYLGSVSGRALVQEHAQRRRSWMTAIAALSHLALPRCPPGGDTMISVIVTPALGFLQAARSRSRMSLQVGEDGLASLGPHQCAEGSKRLEPRPPVQMLAELLANPRTPAARQLLEDLVHVDAGVPLPWRAGLPCSAEDCLPGVGPDGNPDGESLAVQTIFTATWTGGYGTNAPRNPRALATAAVAMLKKYATLHSVLHDYTQTWAKRALDSPAIARLAATHLTAVCQALDLADLHEVLCRALASEVTAALQLAQRSLSDLQSEHVFVAAYRCLVGLSLAHYTVANLRGLCLEPTAVQLAALCELGPGRLELARSAAGVLASQPCPENFSSPAVLEAAAVPQVLEQDIREPRSPGPHSSAMTTASSPSTAYYHQGP